MKNEIAKSLYANAVGELALRYIEALRPDDLLLPAESKALELIAEIKSILDDEAIEDPECFCKIDALVDAFHAKGIPTARHDW